MSNTSGIRPVGHRVLVLPEKTERKTESGIILHDSYADREDMAQIEAIVVEVGLSAWADQAVSGAWAKVGDRVMLAKYSGLLKEGKDKQMYRLVSDLDIVGVLTNE